MRKITILLAMLFITAISFSQTIIFTEDFESGGAAWTDQQLGGGDSLWAFDTGVVAGSGATNDFATLAATFDDDAAGNDAQHDYRQLWHGPEDVSTYGNVTLTYDYALNVLGDGLELLHVSLWDNANTVWINITTYDTDTDPTTDSINVSAAILANPGIDPNNLFFGFGYDDLDGGWAWGAGVDNIELSGVTGDLDTMFIHTSTAANTGGNVTTINHPLLNGNPDAKIVVSHNWEASGQLNVNTEGVWYNGSKWTIFNEIPTTPMIVGATFNVYIDGIDSNTFTQVANAGNSGGTPSYTIIDDAAVNGDPNAIIVFGKYWNPFSVYNPDHYGIFYNGTNWVIFNEDNGATNPIPTDAAFNIVLAPSGSNVVAFKHQATAANTTQYWTNLDHPLVNGNPDANIVFSHNWGSAGDVSNLLVANTQSLWYDDDSGTWRIFNDDIANMNINTLFNVLVMETPAVIDAIAPVVDIVNLPDVVEQCEVTSLTTPTATDNIDGTINGTNNASFPITASTTVTWTYTDSSGNTTTQNQSIIINDSMDPVADAGSLPVVSVECQLASLPIPTATDNCAGSINGVHNATFPIMSSTTITWTYTDANGNSITQNQSVIITDIDNSISQNGAELTANAVGYSYQWVDCNNGNAPIAGETNQVFTATSNGNYAVEITDGVCTVTSGCAIVTTLAISDNDFGAKLNAYPNPTNGIYTIDLGDTYNDVTIKTVNMLGQLVDSKTFNSISKVNLEIKGESGTYFVHIQTLDGKQTSLKLIKL